MALKIYFEIGLPRNWLWRSIGVGNVGLKLRILLSYWYYKDTDLDALLAKYFTPPYPDIFADSGAYSAHSLGMEIDVHAYADWLHKWKHLFAVYANLDVKKDVRAGLRNQAILEDKGLNPLPVFHGGEPFSILQDMIQDYTYIGLGGLAGETRSGSKEMWRFTVKCFQMAKGRSVFHAFGVTNWEIMKSFPWYSVDSSSWGQGFRYGSIPLFDEKQGRFVKATLGDHISCSKHAHIFRQLGFDARDFSDRAKNERAKICAVSALSYMKAEEWLRKRWGEITIPEREGTKGPLLHLSTWPPDIDSGPTSRFVGGDIQWKSMGEVQSGLNLHLACATDAEGPNSGDLTKLSGLNLYLGEHSLDRGGVGDTSRAKEVLEKND